MKINSIQNSNINKYNYAQFKGTVSPEFVKYVDALRCDCLSSVPKQSSNLINNVCNNIINKVQRVMKNCFPQESVLSVDTAKNESRDIITYSNIVLKKYIPEDYILGSVYKKEEDTPIKRLINLRKIVFNGGFFEDASAKDYIKAFIMFYYLKDNRLKESFSKDCIPLFEFYHNKINLLKSETNADKYGLLRSREDYANFLSLLKKCDRL